MKSLLILMLFISGTAFAACPDVANSAGYVRAAASGANNGTNWTNAFTTLPASLSRGCTYYVAGGSYGSHLFSDAISGSTLISIVHPTPAVHGIATGWSDTFATQAVWVQYTVQTSNYFFDGVTGGGPGTWASGFGFAIQMVVSGGQDHAVGVGNGTGTVSNVTIQHFDIKGRGRAYAGGDTDLIYMCDGACGQAYSNWTIRYNYLHDTDRTMLLTWPSAGSGMLIEFNYFARNGVAEHREAWSCGPEVNPIIRYNLFEDIFGTGVIACVNNAGPASGWRIYGNVFYYSGTFTDGNLNTGVIVLSHAICSGASQQCMVTSDFLFANNVVAFFGVNTFTSGLDVEFISGSPGAVCENNIWYHNLNDVANNGHGGCSGGESGTITTANYNWFFGNTHNDTSGANDIIGSASPFAAGSNPNFPILNWALLASIPGTTQTAYTLDMLGNVFSPTYDRGALAFTSGTPTNTVPSFMLLGVD